MEVAVITPWSKKHEEEILEAETIRLAVRLYTPDQSGYETLTAVEFNNTACTANWEPARLLRH